ncbi:MAG: helix-turn-helix domain-containing protein [Sulfurimonas sp.]|jgi:transcriptional regulator with XRE-family HTH domain
MNLKYLIGSAIKTRRKELQIAQADLQDYAEIGSTALSNLEQGKANISIDKLEKILEVLGLELVVKVKAKG